MTLLISNRNRSIGEGLSPLCFHRMSSIPLGHDALPMVHGFPCRRIWWKCQITSTSARSGFVGMYFAKANESFHSLFLAHGRTVHQAQNILEEEPTAEETRNPENWERMDRRFPHWDCNLGCNPSGISPISSRNSVPLSAISKRPIFWAIAPVNAPFSCPKSSLSRRSKGLAAQFNLMNGRSRRELRL